MIQILKIDAKKPHQLTVISSSSYFLLLIGCIFISCQPDKKTEQKEIARVETPVSVKGKVIMAVFAHPDDELYIGPLMAKYAREGAKVQLVTVTDGRYGTGQTDLKPGDELTVLRNEEVNCAAMNMGIEKPIWMGYHDQLKLKDGFFGHVPYIQEIMLKLDSLVTEIEPDVIITWGPDGGSNHMDHRIVGASITQIFLSKIWDKTKTLYYVATPSSHIDEEDKKVLRGVADPYLTTQVAYSEEDRENAIKAMHCYKSQFALDLMESRADRWRNGDQKVYLRPLVKSTKLSENIFFDPI
ncbi:PIG-L family deacetylase [Reichenbachiella sp. MALMAid0571]|uniref:PIG-L deacetylase family protein n=1 Tax=Reichenbachiella sp. MALMAid0571 TaxID=3143939 RepID=UPI0032DF88CB